MWFSRVLSSLGNLITFEDQKWNSNKNREPRKMRKPEQVQRRVTNGTTSVLEALKQKWEKLFYRINLYVIFTFMHMRLFFLVLPLTHNLVSCVCFSEIRVCDAVFQSLIRKHLSEVHVEKRFFFFKYSLDCTHMLVFVGSGAAQWLKAEFLNSLTCLLLYTSYTRKNFFVP